MDNSREKSLRAIFEAQKSLDEARRELDLGNYDRAIEKWREAWLVAQEVMETISEEAIESSSG